MIVELINTGSELMLGRVLNSHQQWLCRRLADLGWVVSRQTAISDSASEIAHAVEESLSRADLVITTGGLGPTSDDLTRDAIARLLGIPLRENPAVLAHVQSYFVRRNRPVPERTQLEAQVPEGAIVFPNENGTAPGLALEVKSGVFRRQKNSNSSWLIMLPGPPRELQPMFIESVVPLIQKVFSPTECVVCRTIRTTGLGESHVQEHCEKALSELIQSSLEIGYCARPGQVDVRLLARGNRAEGMVHAAEAALQSELPQFIYGQEDQAIEQVVVRLLTQRRQTLALAESCTGGCIASRIASVPGASAIFTGGFVTYSNDLKQKMLGVLASTLSGEGAVSAAVAREMAEGARKAACSDYALATTGIAGPTGGSEDKPVGTVFIALATPAGTDVWRQFNPWDRETFRDVTAQQALNSLRVTLLSAQG